METVDTTGAQGHIKSFVKRGGRLTPAQAKAIERLWPGFGVDYSPAPLDLDALFGRKARRIVEIGFGNGDALVALAAAHPESDLLGIEVHPPGVGHCLLGVEEQSLTNVRISRHDAIDVLTQQIPAASLDEVLLYFPDPWPKKRHHKRRIVRAEWVALVASRLKAGGALRLATDWAPYAEWMLEVLDGCALLRNASADGRYVPRPDSRPLTRFERRGQRLGHEVFDLEYRRV